MRFDEEFKDEQVMYDDNIQIEETGFEENMVAGFNHGMDNLNTLSQYWNIAPYYERNRELIGLMHNGEIDGTNFKTEFDYDWSALTRHANDIGFEFKTDRNIMIDVSDNMAEKNKINEEIMAASGVAGTIGAFVGYGGSAFLDPVVIGTSIGGPLALGKVFGSAAGSITKMMAYEGISAAGGEAAVQFGFAQDWQESIGIIHDDETALFHIGAAGVGAAGFTGLIGLLGRMIMKGAGTLTPSEKATLIQTIHEAESLKSAGEKGNWIDTQTKMSKVKSNVQAPYIDAGHAKRLLEGQSSTPQGKATFNLKKPVRAKGEAEDATPKGGVEEKEGYATFDPEDLNPKERDQIDAVIEANQVDPDRKKFEMHSDSGKRNHLLRRVAMLEADNPNCKI